MKFKKRNPIVNADQWFPGVVIADLTEQNITWNSYSGLALGTKELYQSKPFVGGFFNKTTIVFPGDYIVEYEDGTRVCIQKHLFEEDYELIDEPKR